MTHDELIEEDKRWRERLLEFARNPEISDRIGRDLFIAIKEYDELKTKFDFVCKSLQSKKLWP